MNGKIERSVTAACKLTHPLRKDRGLIPDGSSTILRLEGYVEIQVLKRQGKSIRAISAELGVTRNAVRRPLVAGELQPISTMLKENQVLVEELQAEPFTEKDSRILESYLATIRRDGIPKHADMKQRLDILAENNTAIVTLIKAYAPHVTTPAFISEGDKFRNYNSAWRDRWNPVMELFMAGGNYASSGVPFPKDFPAAVEAEIAAAK